MPRKKEKVYEIGQAAIPGWAALWTVDTPYIEIYPASAIDSMSAARATFQRGESYPGAVHVLNTSSDVDDKGRPKDGRTPNDYVRDELRAWYQEDGKEYDEAYGPAAPIEITDEDAGYVRGIVDSVNRTLR